MEGSIYYEPKDYGLETVATYDLLDEAYEFYLLTVWRDKEGKFWAAYDSGCSCPVPYEDHKWPTDFTEVKTYEEVRALIPDYYRNGGDEWTRIQPIDDFRAALRKEGIK